MKYLKQTKILPSLFAACRLRDKEVSLYNEFRGLWEVRKLKTDAGREQQSVAAVCDCDEL